MLLVLKLQIFDRDKVGSFKHRLLNKLPIIHKCCCPELILYLNLQHKISVLLNLKLKQTMYSYEIDFRVLVNIKLWRLNKSGRWAGNWFIWKMVLLWNGCRSIHFGYLPTGESLLTGGVLVYDAYNRGYGNEVALLPPHQAVVPINLATMPGNTCSGSFLACSIEF